MLESHNYLTRKLWTREQAKEISGAVYFSYIRFSSTRKDTKLELLL